MNANQIMGIIVLSTLVLTGVVTFLTMNGVPVLYAVLGVYLLAVWSMFSMQRRALMNFESRVQVGRRHLDGNSLRRYAVTSDLPKMQRPGSRVSLKAVFQE